MPESSQSAEAGARRKRADARRNEQSLLDAAAAVFVAAGVEAPVRRIAAEAGVGVGTIYRHFPTRADLVVAVYRHQVQACADAAPKLLEQASSPYVALADWIDLFIDFLTTKHGLAEALQGDDTGFESLHTYFLDRLVPACATLLRAAVRSGEITEEISAYELMRGIGNLCIVAEGDTRYRPRRLAHLVIAGMRSPEVAARPAHGRDEGAERP